MNEDDFPAGPNDALIDLGNGAWYTRVVDQDERWIGINEWHRHPRTERWCGGLVPFDVPTDLTTGRCVWQVHSLDPLTISPSVLCICGHHGFIRNGRWEPC